VVEVELEVGKTTGDVDARDADFCAVEVSASLPTRRRLLSLAEGVGGGGDSLIRGPWGRDPNPGDRYRLRGRALPAPCQRNTPLGLRESVFFGAWASPDAPFDWLGEDPREGDVENRNGSGLSAV